MMLRIVLDDVFRVAVFIRILAEDFGGGCGRTIVHAEFR